MAGYIRADTADNISPDSLIRAEDLDAEFNALQSAFNNSTGHNHNGGVGEGSPILTVGPTQNIVFSVNQTLPKTASVMDLGSPSKPFKDGYFNGIKGTAVTQSLTDKTANRLLKVGDGGLNGPAPSFANFSGATDSEGFGDVCTFFHSGFDDTASPDTSDNFFGLQVSRSTGSRKAQLVVGFSDGGLYTKTLDSGGVVEDWSSFYSNKNSVGTVSQSGGIPTGALIESGSNSNGYYVRYADGTQICWHKLTGSAPNNPAGAIFMSNNFSWTVPKAFIDSNVVAVASTENASGWVNAWAAGTGAVLLREFSYVTSGTSRTILVKAIGRWY